MTNRTDAAEAFIRRWTASGAAERANYQLFLSEPLTDEEILERLVALNAERAAEEARGLVRWLRPEFQNPTGDGAQQQSLKLADDGTAEDDESDGARPNRSPPSARPADCVAASSPVRSAYQPARASVRFVRAANRVQNRVLAPNGTHFVEAEGRKLSGIGLAPGG